jgi:hypothetical protein
MHSPARSLCRSRGRPLSRSHPLDPRTRKLLPSQESPAQSLSRKFVSALERAFQNGQLNFHADLKLLANPKTFAAWLRPLCREKWVVYLKPPFGGPAYVLQYLGRYTHRVAISNHRLVSFADGQVTFRWRDSADGNKQKLLPLSVNEFLTRFLLHILPQGFVRIRHFGFLANRRRTTLLPLCFQLLGATPEPPAEEHPSSTEDPPDLSLSQVWRTHEDQRKAHGRRDPTPFSTRVNRCCMKPLSPTRKLCVSRRAPHFSTSPPHLFPLKALQQPSSPRFVGSRQLWPWQCEGPCSTAQPRYTLILALSPMEFA